MAKLYFYYSAMNAGKSTTLLQSSYNYQERGMNTVLLIPSIDDRFEKGTITSRIGLKANALVFDKEDDLIPLIEEKIETLKKIACVFVDEAQFLTKKQVQALTYITDILKIPVLCYGLRTDFLGEPFEGSLYLLAWAEELQEIKTICECGKKATMNLRIDANGFAVKEGAQVEIGGNDRYVALCRAHFNAALKLT
jgi:thymidine kinase